MTTFYHQPGTAPFVDTSAFIVTYLGRLPTSRLLARHNFRIARDPGVSGIDSHKPASILISQACLRRYLSEMMDRIAKGPEDVKKSVRDEDELP
jgi:hypothetical protein